MNSSGLVRTTVVCALAGVMLGVLVLFGLTFFEWNADFESLIWLDSKLKNIYWWPLAISVLLLIVVSLIKLKPVSWSVTSEVHWIQMLWICGFVITFVLFLSSGFSGKTVLVRSQGAVTEAFVREKWETVRPEQFEKIVQQNARRRISFFQFGLLLCMGIAGGSLKCVMLRK
jgi:hypothetical protein